LSPAWSAAAKPTPLLAGLRNSHCLATARRGGALFLLEQYREVHQLMLVADGGAVNFYQRIGFQRAGKTTSMWIYAGEDH
jgi:hypothetical protein